MPRTLIDVALFCAFAPFARCEGENLSPVGFEPTATRLKGACSTPELRAHTRDYSKEKSSAWEHLAAASATKKVFKARPFSERDIMAVR